MNHLTNRGYNDDDSERLDDSKLSHIEKLAATLDFRTEQEYFEYCIDSHTNGNLSQCRRLFEDLTKDGQKELVKIARDIDDSAYEFYFNLL